MVPFDQGLSQGFWVCTQNRQGLPHALDDAAMFAHNRSSTLDEDMGDHMWSEALHCQTFSVLSYDATMHVTRQSTNKWQSGTNTTAAAGK